MDKELRMLYEMNDRIDADKASDGAFETAGLLPKNEEDVSEYRKLIELRRYRNRLISEGKFTY